MSTHHPKVVICAGGGGVGKTTSAAAVAFAGARHGHRTLIVTVDPARRLAQAMGVALSASVQRVPAEPAIEDRLSALMPEPRVSTRTFVEILFQDEPDGLQRLLENRLYRTLADSLAGMHDLIAMMLIAHMATIGRYDLVVIDTAPSRYALDSLAYPSRLATLLEGRILQWFGTLAERVTHREPTTRLRRRDRVAQWGKMRVEGALNRILDPRTLSDLAGLFADLNLVRHRFAGLARRCDALVRQARYLIVTVPSGAAEADARYLGRRLRDQRRASPTLILNRSDPVPPKWLSELAQGEGIPAPIGEAVSRLSQEVENRGRAADALERALRRQFVREPMLRLPTVEIQDPVQVVRQLADAMEPHLPSILGQPPGQPTNLL